MALMRDPRVGIVQTPQHFVNPDPIQGNLALSGVWPDEQRYFFDVLMASKDAWGAAFCCGTSSVIRFNPLMQIGGFPTDSVTEDYLVTLRLRRSAIRPSISTNNFHSDSRQKGSRNTLPSAAAGASASCRSVAAKAVLSASRNRLTFVDRVILSETFLYWSATHAFRL